jgi:hypothetical protein
MKSWLIVTTAVTLLSHSCFSQTCSLQGTYSVGPTGSYHTLTSAAAALVTNGVSNPVILELQPAYSSSGEAFPLNFNNIPCIDSTRSVTIRPQVGATSLNIQGSSTIAIIDLNNGRFIHFDGRPGGTGSSNQLSISNTNGSGVTVRLINDASWNTLEYLNISGVNASAASGVISFLTTNQTITNGNNYNKISNCNITKGAANPVNCIYALGTVDKKNIGNEILNCSISDYYAASGNTIGIYLGANNSAWHISGNSIFHSQQKDFNNPFYIGAIFINDSTSSEFNIENNFIGGSAPGCTGAAITYGTSFYPIQLIVGTTSFTSVQNNSVANMNFNITEDGSANAGILLRMGKFHCGDIAGNTIGSQSITNSINIGVGTSLFTFNAIQAGNTDLTNSGVDTCYIKNNKIGGIYAYFLPNFYLEGPIHGIALVAQRKGFVDISGNTIGSPSVPGSITNYTYGGGGNEVDGIFAETHSSIPIALQPKNVISNNTIVNLVGESYGIRAERGSFQVLNNQVHHLYGGAPNQASLIVRGIICEAGNDNTLISGNIIHSLTSPATSGNGTNDVGGIDIRNSSGATVTKNYIHSLQSNTASGNDIVGINIESPGRVFVTDNMVRLGLDTLGNPVSGNQKIFGIQLSNDSAILSNNSVYIGGGGTGESAALMIPSIANAGTVINNIFVNQRSATQGSTRYHYAIRLDNATTNVSKLNFNLYYAAGTNAYLGIFNGINQTTIINWRKAIKADSNSIFYDPHFVNPNGTAVTGDLHLASPTPGESSGTPNSFVTNDIDNEDRNSLTPVDLGADAGNFIYQDGDAPILTHNTFLGQPAVSSFVYTVKITDNGSGVDTSGANKPRMWYRKKYTDISNWISSPGNLVSGYLNDGIWGFKPDFSSLTLNPGDSVEYYFVAQDKGTIPNIGYSNIAGTSHTNVNSQTTAPASPLRLLIYGIFPDTLYVGAGQPYTSLTKNGGVFEASHKYLFDSTHNAAAVLITSDLAEDGTWAYTSLTKNGPLVTFQTNTPTVKQIKASNVLHNLIRLDGVNNVIVDGRVNGSGRYLQFTNFCSITGSAYVCMTVSNASGFSLINTILESNMGPNETGSNLLSIGGALRKTLIKGNLLRPAAGGAGMPVAGMWIVGTSLPDTVRIVQNEITDFRQTGILLGGTTTTGSIMLDSNHFYFDAGVSPPGSLNFFYVNTSFKPIITNNFIGGTAPYCGGSPLTFNTASGGDVNGMYLYVPDQEYTTIQGNTIQNISIPQFGYNFAGILVATGVVNFSGNTIGSLANPASITNKQTVAGVLGNLSQTNFTRIENNIISGLQGSYFQGISFSNGQVIIKNNKILNSVAGLTVSGLPGYKGISVTISNGSVEGNLISGLGCLAYPSYTIGMELAAGANEVIVSRNKVTDLYSPATSSPGLVGISLTKGNFNIQNNQISLSNRDSVSDIPITGISMNTSSGTGYNSRIYYNTVRISGTATGVSNSYAVRVASGNPIAFFRNNLLYNERAGGTGRHVALGDNTSGTAGVWPAGGSPNNNLYVTTDTSYVNEWRSNGAVSMKQWRTLTLGDSASYGSKNVDVPSDLLFVSRTAGDLNINNQSPVSWYVNGKGIPVSSISGDFDSAANVRSTTVVSGATDIGSDEFNTPTLPPPLVVLGNHATGATEFFSFNERTMASITWGPTGTLPTLGSARYYSGVWPNDTTNNNSINGARYLNAWWDIPATGGSNYTYSLTLFYDSSILGKVKDPATMLVNKRQPAVPGSWVVIHPNNLNAAGKTITINNQNSFSEFTATDSLATLASGAPVPDLLINNQNINPSTIGVAGNIMVSFAEVNQGPGSAQPHKIYFYLSADNILTPATNGDTLIGEFDIVNPLNQNSSTGSLNTVLTIPCGTVPRTYNLFITADGNGAVFESNENNNQVLAPITITPGIVTPPTPLISASPGITACLPNTITLTANSAGCSSCTYVWTSGVSGPSIVVNSTGNYTVTATNQCGNASATQLVTLNSPPVVNVFANSFGICAGSSLVLNAAGATNYNWTGPGLSTTSGSPVNATPAATGIATYNVVGTTNGCSNSKSLSVNVASSVTPAINITYTGCPSATLNFQANSTNGGSNPQYEWRVDNVASGTGPTFVLNNAQNNNQVSCTVTSNAACASPTTATTTETITCIVTAIPNIVGLESYLVAPNPFHGSIVVNLKLSQAKNVSFDVYDLSAHIVYRVNPMSWTGQNSKEINLSNLTDGIYFLRITVNKQYFIYKIVKVK